MDIVSKFLLPGLLLLLTLGFGFWLSRTGKPLNVVVSTVHKLAALAAVIMAAVQTCDGLRGVEVRPPLVAPLALIALCAAALFVTGALMSADKPIYARLPTIHKIATLLAVIAAFLALYLLGARAA